MKKYFVILHQDEIEYFKDQFELGIYSSVKSYCSNGKSTSPLSIRDIQKRCKVSVGKISKSLPLMVESKVFEVVGEEARSGGNVPIYRCSLGEQLGVHTTNTKDVSGVHEANTEKQLGVHINDLGVHISGLGVHGVGTKHDKVKSNKVNNTKTKSSSYKDVANEEILTYYQTVSPFERMTPSRKEKINARLKTFSVDEIKKAVGNCFTDSFHTGNNDTGWKANFDYIFKNDENMDKLLNLKPRKKAGLSDEELEKRII